MKRNTASEHAADRALEMRGGYETRVNAAAESELGTVASVPSFVSKWLADKVSNQRLRLRGSGKVRFGVVSRRRALASVRILERIAADAQAVPGAAARGPLRDARSRAAGERGCPLKLV